MSSIQLHTALLAQATAILENAMSQMDNLADISLQDFEGFLNALKEHIRVADDACWISLFDSDILLASRQIPILTRSRATNFSDVPMKVDVSLNDVSLNDVSLNNFSLDDLPTRPAELVRQITNDSLNLINGTPTWTDYWEDSGYNNDDIADNEVADNEEEVVDNEVANNEEEEEDDDYCLPPPPILIRQTSIGYYTPNCEPEDFVYSEADELLIPEALRAQKPVIRITKLDRRT